MPNGSFSRSIAERVSAFVLKYRLAEEPGSSYRIEVESAADAARAVRPLRARAGELGLAPQRIGLWDWSAGAELELATRYEAVGVPAEVHLFASGGHGFNLGRPASQRGVRHWPDRLVEWLYERGLLRR